MVMVLMTTIQTGASVWDTSMNQTGFMDSIATQLNIKSHEDWYKLSHAELKGMVLMSMIVICVLMRQNSHPMQLIMITTIIASTTINHCHHHQTTIIHNVTPST